jgi:hypothetical protein
MRHGELRFRCRHEAEIRGASANPPAVLVERFHDGFWRIFTALAQLAAVARE